MPSVLDQRLRLDLLLQLHDPPQQRVGPRGAARDVNVDGDEIVDTGNRAVRALERTAGDRAGPHRDDVLRVGHLVVDTPYSGRHARGNGAGHDHEVSLAG